MLTSKPFRSLLTFMKDWAATNRALSSSKPVPKLQPLFDPSLIDSAAAGNIDARSPDPRILEIAAKLPVHRFDHWASAGPSTPEWALPLTKIPPELASQKDIKLGKPAPYHTWDATAPCELVYFPTNPSLPPPFHQRSGSWVPETIYFRPPETSSSFCLKKHYERKEKILQLTSTSMQARTRPSSSHPPKRTPSIFTRLRRPKRESRTRMPCSPTSGPPSSAPAASKKARSIS